jgi:hypothetical protein
MQGSGDAAYLICMLCCLNIQAQRRAVCITHTAPQLPPSLGKHACAAASQPSDTLHCNSCTCKQSMPCEPLLPHSHQLGCCSWGCCKPAAVVLRLQAPCKASAYMGGETAPDLTKSNLQLLVTLNCTIVCIKSNPHQTGASSPQMPSHDLMRSQLQASQQAADTAVAVVAVRTPTSHSSSNTNAALRLKRRETPNKPRQVSWL